MILNPLDFDATAFLWLYGLMFVASLALSRFSANKLRPEGNARVVPDADSLALLAGGPGRLAATATARLMATGRWRAAPDRQDLRRAVRRESRRIKAGLERQGLWMTDAMAGQLRLVQTLPFAALLVLGLARLAGGQAQGYLVLLLAITLGVGVSRLGIDRRTRAGIDAVRLAGRNAGRLRRGADPT